MSKADVSVITASLNTSNTLKTCLDSVRSQVGVHVEHIVVDGGSCDNTCNLLQVNEHSKLRWISEPDDGIADAMNKGAEMANGYWLLFLQADDRLQKKDSLERILRNEQASKSDLVAARIVLGEEAVQSSGKSDYTNGWPSLTPFKQPFPHQGLLVSRKAWEAIGLYDTNYKITMDFDWLLRAFWSRLTVSRVNVVLAQVSNKGVSSATGGKLFRQRLFEEQRARLKNAPSGLWILLYKLFIIMYFPYRYSRTKIGY